MKHSWVVYLRTANFCQVACKSCPAGRRENLNSDYLTPVMLTRMLDKIAHEANIRSIIYHHYNEPILNPFIAELIRIGKQDFKTITQLSTNLSHAPKVFRRLVDCLNYEIDHITISLSGFTQKIAERSHKNSDIEQVKRNMREIARIKSPKTNVVVAWHSYSYNAHERPLMKSLVDELGFKWDPFNPGVLPLELALARWEDGVVDAAEEDIIHKLKDVKQRCFDRRHWSCTLQQRSIVLDSNANIHNCSHMNSYANIVHNLFDIPSLEWYNNWRYSCSLCTHCKSLGGQVYMEQTYMSPQRIALLRKAIDTYRSLEIGYHFPRVSKFLSSHVFLRPEHK